MKTGTLISYKELRKINPEAAGRAVLEYLRDNEYNHALPACIPHALQGSGSSLNVPAGEGDIFTLRQPSNKYDLLKGAYEHPLTSLARLGLL